MNLRTVILILLGTGSLGKTLASDSIPQSAQWENLLHKGDSCELLSDTYHALQYYQEALALLPLPPAIRKTAQCQYNRGHYEDCLRTLDLLRKDSIGHQDMKLQYNCYINLNHKDSILSLGNDILEKYPYDSKVTETLAQYYNTSELPDSALHYTQKYKQKDSTNIFVNRQQAFAFYQKQEYARALEEYRQLVALNDSSTSTIYYSGLCYAQCDSLLPAYKCLLKAAERHKFNHPNILSQLGIVCVEIGIPSGVEYLQKAIELIKPEDKLLFNLTNTLAEGYLKIRKYDECVKCLKECQTYDSSTPNTVFRLAQAYGLMGNTKMEKQAYQQFIRMAEQEKDSGSSWNTLIEDAKRRIRMIQEEEFFQDGKTD